jgi:hypothetical protein
MDDLDQVALSADGMASWFIWAHKQPEAPLIAELERRFSMTLVGRYLKAEVYRLERRPAPHAAAEPNR